MVDDAALNEFVRNYYGGLSETVYADPLPLDAADTALVLIDIQKCISKDFYVEAFKGYGMEIEPIEPILDRMEDYLQQALGNVERVLNRCRDKGIRPVHVRIQSNLPGAEDTGALHASAGMFYPPGSVASEFLPQAEPRDDEIVLNKTCSGAVVGTHIDQVLRNLGIRNVIVVGFYTDQCISTSVRDLSDLGYKVSIVEDAVGAMSPERHEYALQGIRKIYANSETTDELVVRLDQL